MKVELFKCMAGCINEEKNKGFLKFNHANVAGHDADFWRKNDLVKIQIYMYEKKKEPCLKVEPIDKAFNLKCLAKLTNKR